MKKAGDGGVSVILLDEDADGALVWRQARVFAERALGSAELDPGCAAALQRLLCALGDEVALDLRGQAKGERKDLALNIVAEAEAVLDCADAAAAIHAEVEDVHDHVKRSSEAGNLRRDDGVPGCDAIEQLSELAFLRLGGTGDGLCNPSVNSEPFPLAKLRDLKALVGLRLFLGGDPDISINHIL